MKKVRSWRKQYRRLRECNIIRDDKKHYKERSSKYGEQSPYLLNPKKIICNAFLVIQSQDATIKF